MTPAQYFNAVDRVAQATQQVERAPGVSTGEYEIALAELREATVALDQLLLSATATERRLVSVKLSTHGDSKVLKDAFADLQEARSVIDDIYARRPHLPGSPEWMEWDRQIREANAHWSAAFARFQHACDQLTDSVREISGQIKLDYRRFLDEVDA